MSQKFTKQNLSLKWITTFSLIYLMRVTHAIPQTLILLRDLLLSINSTFPGITKNNKPNNLLYPQRSSVL